MKRKLLSLISAAVMIAFVTSAFTLTALANEGDSETEIILYDEEPTVTVGDLNADGTVDALDLVRLRKALLNYEDCNEINDLNGDGNLDVIDYVRMKRYLVDNTVPLGK